MTSPDSAPTPGRTAGPDAPRAVVTALLDALERLDLEDAVALLDPDVVYVNVSLPAARGLEQTRRILAGLTRFASDFEARVHRIAADGTTVLTERTDTLVFGRVRVSFWVCGVFEVRDGRITLWRDYFDWAAVTGAAVSGLGRALTAGRSRVGLAARPA